MKKYTAVLSVITILTLPAGLRACDCGCDDPPAGYVHFKDGLNPNGPVDVDSRYGAQENYTTTFTYRDYGPARVVVPPPAPVTKRPAS